jgi:hypothetical protein
MTTIERSSCPACKKRFFFPSDRDRHICDPVFWIIPQTTEVFDAWVEPSKIRGLGPEDALIDWITQYEADDTEYPIATGQESPKFRVFTAQQYAEALVDMDSPQEVKWLEVPGHVYQVSGEFTPSYSTNQCSEDE